jgi:hypothetical protein
MQVARKKLQIAFMQLVRQAVFKVNRIGIFRDNRSHE